MIFKPNFKLTTRATWKKQIAYLKKQSIIKSINEIPPTKTLQINLKKQTFYYNNSPYQLPQITILLNKQLTYETNHELTNTLPRVRVYFTNHPRRQHPYNLANKKLCFGNVTPLAAKLIQTNDLVGLIYLIIKILQTPHDEYVPRFLKYKIKKWTKKSKKSVKKSRKMKK